MRDCLDSRVTSRHTFARRYRLFAAAALALATSAAPSAQTPAVVAAQTPPVSATVPEVVGVVNVTQAARRANKADERAGDVDTNGNQTVVAELKDTLKIKIRNLESWRKEGTNAKTSLVLFLDSVELKNVVAMPAARDSGDAADVGAVLVMLEPQNDQQGVVRKAWVQVLRAAMERNDRPLDQQTIPVSVGIAGSSPFASKTEIALDVWPWYTKYVIGFLVIVAGLLLWLGYSSNLLRDSNGTANPPFSLAKHQMALWFVVIVGSYLYVWLITGFYSSLSSTALILIGISGATGLVAVTIDANKRVDAVKTRIALEAERAALEQTVNDPTNGLLAQLATAPPGSPAALQLTADATPKLARLNELKTLLLAPPPGAQQSDRWDKDILSDENGISFHRFQMAIWTLVLVMVFVRAVYTDILMPDFDTTLLGLMGISSGTYLGFKFPEKTT
jgi:hypothetical protein